VFPQVSRCLHKLAATHQSACRWTRGRRFESKPFAFLAFLVACTATVTSRIAFGQSAARCAPGHTLGLTERPAWTCGGLKTPIPRTSERTRSVRLTGLWLGPFQVELVVFGRAERVGWSRIAPRGKSCFSADVSTRDDEGSIDGMGRSCPMCLFTGCFSGCVAGRSAATTKGKAMAACISITGRRGGDGFGMLERFCDLIRTPRRAALDWGTAGVSARGARLRLFGRLYLAVRALDLLASGRVAPTGSGSGG
jgi:hypothetical protein